MTAPRIGSLTWRPATERPDLLGAPVAAAISLLPGPAWVAEIDDDLADTAAFSEAYGVPLEVSAIDSFASVTDAPERSLSIVARTPVDLAEVYLADDKVFCDTLDKCRDVSLFLLDCAGRWLGDD